MRACSNCGDTDNASDGWAAFDFPEGEKVYVCPRCAHPAKGPFLETVNGVFEDPSGTAHAVIGVWPDFRKACRPEAHANIRPKQVHAPGYLGSGLLCQLPGCFDHLSKVASGLGRTE